MAWRHLRSGCSARWRSTTRRRIAWLGRGQARELLGYLVARRRAPATTDDIVHALWDDDPPATATTIVHGLVRRIRGALGTAAVLSDLRGYHLGPCVDDVDLWNLLELIEAGELAGALGGLAGARLRAVRRSPVGARRRRACPSRGRARPGSAPPHSPARAGPTADRPAPGAGGRAGRTAALADRHHRGHGRCREDAAGSRGRGGRGGTGDAHRCRGGGRPDGLPGGHRARPGEQRRRGDGPALHGEPGRPGTAAPPRRRLRRRPRGQRQRGRAPRRLVPPGDGAGHVEGRARASQASRSFRSCPSPTRRTLGATRWSSCSTGCGRWGGRRGRRTARPRST